MSTTDKIYAKLQQFVEKISSHRFFGGHFLRACPIRKIARTFIFGTKIILYFQKFKSFL